MPKKKGFTPRSKEEIQEELNGLYADVTKGIKDVIASGRYAEYLSFVGKFRKYSLNNSILIFLQHPQARFAAGYCDWQKKFKRHVKYGEKGIHIIGGHEYSYEVEVEDENGNKKKEPRFKMKYFPTVVYGDDQTDGEPLPELCKMLTDDIESYQTFKVRLEKVSPVPVSYAPISGGAHGYFSPSENKIVVCSGMPQTQTIKTLVHEIAHSMMHNDSVKEKFDRETKEIQAESTAYAVLKHFGIDSSEYSFPYLMSWAKGKSDKEIHTALDFVWDSAMTIIKGVED